MGFNVTGLTAYTKTNEQMLVTKSLFSAKSASLFSKLTGVKSSIQVPILDQAIYLQAGGSCGFNASGDTTISSRNLTIGKIKVNMEWCVKDLETKYTQLLLNNGAYYESLPGKIEGAMVEQYAGLVGQAIETAIWQGDTGSADGNLNKFDGLQKIIGAASGVVNANTTAYITTVTAITASNVISVFQAIYNAIPVQILDKADLAVFCGVDVMRLYQMALVNANLFHYTPTQDAQTDTYIHGTNIKIIAVNGLNGTSDLYAGRTSNMFVGVDLESDEDSFKIWYSDDFDLVRFKAEFKYGTQIAIPSEIVKFIV